MKKAKQKEIDAARSYGNSVNAMAVLSTSTREPYSWKISLEACSQSELQLLLEFMQNRDVKSHSGYKSKIRKIQSRLRSNRV